MERERRESAGILKKLTREDKNRVKKVKEAIKPRTTPSGFLLPDLSTEERIIGRSGRIQGERIVTNPAMKANTIKRIIFRLYF